MEKRPITTLFLLLSLDGKINSGNNDTLDADRDWCTIDGVKEGLHQYYEIEETTDSCSFNTGRVMAKIGVNTRTEKPNKMPVDFVILDNLPHLNAQGVRYLSDWVRTLYLVTNNPHHPAYELQKECTNITILPQTEEINLAQLLCTLKQCYGIERITLQSGGSLNGLWLRNDLIDYVDVVIAPLLVGGKDTSTLIDGDAISSPLQLHKLRAMKLLQATTLQNSYLRLQYEVIHHANR